MSAFVWLDYSERERRKMLDVVDLFGEHDTQDELGIGSVRDAFADMRFPGTSTIMTRARYFLLVPWTYQRLERSRVGSAKMTASARQAELNLVEPIERSDDNDGNIGKVAKTALKRLPSSVYWQGLNRFHCEEKLEQARDGRKPEQIAFIPEEADALAGLGEVNRELVRELGRRCPDQRIATVDQDATIIESHKQQALRTYESERGYQPMLAGLGGDGRGAGR
ncbi:MAG: DUF6361 family protein [Acidobacteriaceae bacterium]